MPIFGLALSETRPRIFLTYDSDSGGVKTSTPILPYDHSVLWNVTIILLPFVGLNLEMTS